MEILKVTENKDGSAEVNMNLTTEENRLLIEYAVNDLLRKRCIKGMEKENVKT